MARSEGGWGVGTAPSFARERHSRVSRIEKLAWVERLLERGHSTPGSSSVCTKELDVIPEVRKVGAMNRTEYRSDREDAQVR